MQFDILGKVLKNEVIDFIDILNNLRQSGVCQIIHSGGSIKNCCRKCLKTGQFMF